MANFSGSGIQAPAAYAESITPADADLALFTAGSFTRAIYVGGTGDVAVKMAGGDDEGDSIVVFKAVPEGAILPLRVSQIRTTDTTATLIVALW